MCRTLTLPAVTSPMESPTRQPFSFHITQHSGWYSEGRRRTFCAEPRTAGTVILAVGIQTDSIILLSFVTVLFPKDSVVAARKPRTAWYIPTNNPGITETNPNSNAPRRVLTGSRINAIAWVSNVVG